MKYRDTYIYRFIAIMQVSIVLPVIIQYRPALVCRLFCLVFILITYCGLESLVNS